MKRRINTTILFIVVVSLCSIQIVIPQSHHPLADSLFNVLDHNPNDSASYRALNNIVNSLYYQDADLAMTISEMELKYAQRAKNHYASGRALLNIGIVFDLKGKYDSAIINYNAALKLAEINELDNLKGDIFNNFSITLAVLGNMEESISYALKALQVFEQMKDSARIAKIFNNLGARYSEMEYHDKSLEYYEKAAIINEKLGDNRKLAFNYGNIGLLYYDQHQDEKALEYFEKSILLQDTINDKFNFSIALHNLALAYQRLKQFDKAIMYDSRAYDIANEINDELGKTMCLNGLASTNRDMGNNQKALEYFYEAEKLAEKVGARYYLINIYANIALIHAKLKNYQQAYVYNQKYSSLNDSIMITEKDKALSKIKEFEDDKKQKEIEILTKDSEIQKLNIKRQKILRNSISAVGLLILLLAIGLLNRYRYLRKTRNELSEKNIIINKEKERSDELLLNILPAQTAEELKNTGYSKARHFDLVTVMFTDFKGFTYMAEKLSPQELVDEIDYCFKHFDQIISKHNIEKIKTIGDAYMCAGGLPVANTTNPIDVVRAGIEIQNFMHDMKQKRKAKNEPYFELRLGINTGPVVAGIVGTKKFQYDIWGDTVNIASRMESSGEIGKVNISQMTYEKVKDQFNCEHRGKIEAKNKGAIDMYFVKSYIKKSTL
ncbi:MAG: adenylate/guanylate cyclase domain-containing protein [Bacteroidales bacterium]